MQLTYLVQWQPHMVGTSDHNLGDTVAPRGWVTCPGHTEDRLLSPGPTQAGCLQNFTLSHHLSRFPVALENLAGLVALGPQVHVATVSSLWSKHSHVPPAWPVSPVSVTSWPPALRYLQTLL